MASVGVGDNINQGGRMQTIVDQLDHHSEIILDNGDGTFTRRTTYLGPGHPIHPERRDRYIVEVPVVKITAMVEELVG